MSILCDIISLEIHAKFTQNSRKVYATPMVTVLKCAGTFSHSLSELVRRRQRIMLRKVIAVLLVLIVLLIVYSALLIAGLVGSPSVDAFQTIVDGAIAIVVALIAYVFKGIDSSTPSR